MEDWKPLCQHVGRQKSQAAPSLPMERLTPRLTRQDLLGSRLTSESMQQPKDAVTISKKAIRSSFHAQPRFIFSMNEKQCETGQVCQSSIGSLDYALLHFQESPGSTLSIRALNALPWWFCQGAKKWKQEKAPRVLLPLLTQAAVITQTQFTTTTKAPQSLVQLHILVAHTRGDIR